ncbi:restriction endonuclease subunit S [Akkermansia muciniphila]
MNSIPKGYKKTEVGVIPEKWEVKKLGEACKILRGGSPRPIEDYLTTSPSGVNWIKIGDVSSDSKYITNTEEKIIPEGISYSRSVYPGDFLLSNSMSYGRPYILNIEGCIHDGWLVLQDFCCFFESDFLYYYLSSASVLKQYEMKASGSSVHNLNKDLVADVIVVIPSLCEQQAIAEVLSDMDTLIQTQKELIAKKRDIKQGTMQDLLFGRVRLPGYETKGWKHTDIGDIPDDWEVKSFSNIAYLIKETVDPTSNKSLNCVELEHLSSSTGLLIDFDDLSDKSSLKNKFQQGDVLFGKLRSYLRKFWLCQWSGCCSTEIWVFRPKSITNSVFLKYIVSSDQFVKVASESFGTHMPRADWNVVKECFFAIPAFYSEQQAIAQVLSDMDDELETLEAELEKLNHMKRGMMQELLTGRIRLI